MTKIAILLIKFYQNVISKYILVRRVAGFIQLVQNILCWHIQNMVLLKEPI